ncbi:MAG TPA: helical backbone metal receptor [Thermoanaerobaculia bacterium]|nr:helical backbone metal receptor [Thermoanaerobaculia bacterium]
MSSSAADIVDALGRPHRFEHPPARVISLVPSMTETLFAIGAGRALVGITDFCIFPRDEVDALPRVGGTKTPRIDQIRELAPELVYVNLEENLRRHADEIAEIAPLFATEPKSVAGVARLIRQLGDIHRCQGEATRWSEAIERQAAAIGRAARFTFACAIWKDPWMWCGGDTYVSDLVVTAGGVNLFGNEMRYPKHGLEETLALNPDVVFLPDEPFLFTAADAEGVKAMTGARVVGPFPGHLFTWHGTRTLEGLRFLGRTLGTTVAKA